SISEIRIYFDTDFDHPLESTLWGHPESAIPFCVKRFRIKDESGGCFLGVCGDVRYVPDFATAQTAQAYLDLYDITEISKYKEAAIQAAKIYTTHIYTHPISTTEPKWVKDKQLRDWEISQAGLGFEHGGAIGSANSHGPILLASHAGMF